MLSSLSSVMSDLVSPAEKEATSPAPASSAAPAATPKEELETALACARRQRTALDESLDSLAAEQRRVDERAEVLQAALAEEMQRIRGALDEAEATPGLSELKTAYDTLAIHFARQTPLSESEASTVLRNAVAARKRIKRAQNMIGRWPNCQGARTAPRLPGCVLFNAGAVGQMALQRSISRELQGAITRATGSRYCVPASSMLQIP